MQTASPPSSQPPAGQKNKKLLDLVGDAIRVKHYSFRTEQTYKDWIVRYILYHKKRHPKDMGPEEIQAFITHLAVERSLSASSQNPCTELVEVRPSAPSSSSTATSSSVAASPSSRSIPDGNLPSTPVTRPRHLTPKHLTPKHLTPDT